MSILVMVLVGGMMLGDGPAKVSIETEQRLDLSGEWEGTWNVPWNWLGAKKCPVTLARGELCGGDASTILYLDSGAIIDEGGGRLWIKWSANVVCLGIYEQDEDHLLICFCNARKGRPVSFRSDNGQDLIILRRFKSGK